MTKLLAILAATTAFAGVASAQDIKELNIGILGGENAQDRLANNACLEKYMSDAVGVPVKLYAPADYDGVLQGLTGGTIDMALLGASGYAKIALDDPGAVTPDPDHGEPGRVLCLLLDRFHAQGDRHHLA